MKRFLLAAIAVLLLLPASASAHRTVSEARARQIVEDLYRNHCGNGAYWICDLYPTYSWAVPEGAHSWSAEVHWREVYVPTWHVRGCGVVARVEHDYVAQIERWEWCW
jgi:hypothetical protein